MKVIVAGPRDYYRYRDVVSAIWGSRFEISEIVSGGATGVDSLGERYAHEHNIPVKRFKAEWEKYGRGAGPTRNREMARYADALIALQDEDDPTPGTSNMVKTATDAGLKVYVYRIERR